MPETTGGVVLRRNFAYQLTLPNYPTSTAPPFTFEDLAGDENWHYSVHRKSTGPAISSGLPTRPRESHAEFLPRFGSSSAGSNICVDQPGATEFT